MKPGIAPENHFVTTAGAVHVCAIFAFGPDDAALCSALYLTEASIAQMTASDSGGSTEIVIDGDEHTPLDPLRTPFPASASAGSGPATAAQANPQALKGAKPDGAPKRVYSHGAP